MVDFSRALRVLTVIIWAASAATIAVSFYAANVVDYHYLPGTSFNTYNSILTGSALVLALVILTGIVTLHRVDTSSQQVLGAIGESLDLEGVLPLKASVVQGAVERELREAPNSSKTEWLQRAFDEYSGLQRLRRDVKSLLAAPVGLLAAIFAISAWALPATEVFLNTLSVLNTTLLFFVTYGMVVAIVAVIAATLVLFSTRPTST